MQSAIEVLQSVFGFDSFRGYQKEIVAEVIDGKSALVLMPTGGGKSLCFQIPAIVRQGCAIVVSPLMALMKDQVDALLQNDVRAAYINSSLEFDQIKMIQQQLLRGELDLLYVTPERVVTPFFLDLLQRVQLALFAIDEAHCVSEWGHDFRPEYVQLSILRELFPAIPLIALTATADGATKNEIIAKLNLEQARVFVAGFDRPNIRYTIVEKKNAKAQFLNFYRTHHRGDAGIIYCLSRKKVEKISEWLQGEGVEALPYHAGLNGRVRQRNQETFIQEEGVVMVATIAFGMGIDKPNVRFVAHLDLPKGIESYYQETGRAGRDGLAANAWMCYGLGDIIILKKMIESSDADHNRKRVEQRKLDSILGLCETISCRRQVLLNYFEDNSIENCNNCDTCLNPVESWDGTIAAQKALSCIYRTGERFGVAHLVDVLIGEETVKVSSFSHQHLSVFGVGKDITKNSWRSIFRQLIASGYLQINLELYGSLKLTEKCKQILKSKQKILFRVDPNPKINTSKKKTKLLAKKMSVSSTNSDGDLFLELKALRLKISRKKKIPPYAIFHDRTLIEMAEIKPASLEEMNDLYGIGVMKLKKYGDLFLDAISKV